ncbi:SagB/ThcOx family dehydrogenase [Pseudomonas amygdali]
MGKTIEISPFEIGRFSDQEIYDHVIEFHSRSNYSLFPGTAPRCYLSSAPDKALAEMIESELSIWPGIKPSAQLTSARTALLRDESAEFFDDASVLEFSVIDQLMTNSFCARSSESRKRPYPSGGALYPIEVFVCRVSNNVDNWPTKENILHLLPLSRHLEAMTLHAPDIILSNLSGGDTGLLGQPHFALVYAMLFERALFKYRTRGYRLALMEAGSMYQTADLNAQALGLRSRVWAGFTDFQVAKTIGIDMRHMAPLVVQFFGNANN